MYMSERVFRAREDELQNALLCLRSTVIRKIEGSVAEGHTPSAVRRCRLPSSIERRPLACLLSVSLLPWLVEYETQVDPPEVDGIVSIVSRLVHEIFRIN